MENKYKYQVGALILAIVGIVIGGIYTGKNKNKELLKLQEQHAQELEKLNKESLKEIKAREEKIELFEESARKDSLQILELEKSLAQDGVKVERERDRIKNLSNEDKKKWLVNRYSDTPK